MSPASPKPPKGSAKRLKAAAARQEAKQAKAVRAACVTRDGYCVLEAREFGFRQCAGPSEWAHLGEHRRSKTRGQAPERRHTTAGSAMLCRGHHTAYDAHKIDLEPEDAEQGMNGAFLVIIRPQVFGLRVSR